MSFVNICTVESSSKCAVLFDDGITQKMTYCHFNGVVKDLLLKIRKTYKNMEEHIKESSVIGVYGDANLYLPAIVYTIFMLPAVFIPLATNKKSSTMISCLRKCGVKFVFVQKVLSPDFLLAIKDEVSVRRKITFDSCKEYVLVELDTILDVIYRTMFYIVQSSGSTGEPKIIQVPWQCVEPNVIDIRSTFNTMSADVIFISSSLTFDASIVLMLLAWSSGATMLLVPGDVMRNPEKLPCILLRNRVSILQCTTSLLLMVGNEQLRKFLVNDDLRVLAIGGERFLSKEKLCNLISSKRKDFCIFNIYGTSEVSAWATLHCLKSSDYDQIFESAETTDWVPIGKALSKTVVEVRNELMERIHNGIGRIFIGGETRVCIVDNENSNSMTNMRDSGDLGIIKDGNIYYCGRTDNRVKHNGQIISLDLLQELIETINNVSRCCCVHKFFAQMEKLFMFVTISCAEGNISYVEKNILKLIGRKLSTSYLPDRIVFLKNFVINNHGKVDKEELFNLPDVRIQCANSLSEHLRNCWMLSLNKIDTEEEPKPTDTFIRCGGDSFSAAFLVNKLSTYLNSTSCFNFEFVFNTILTGTYHDVELVMENFLQMKTIQPEQYFPVSPKCVSKIDEVLKTSDTCEHYVAFCRQNKIITCKCTGKNTMHRHPSITIQSGILKFTKLWQYDLKKCIDSSPLVVVSNDFKDGIVYIGSHSHIFAAVSLQDGRMLWTTFLGDRIESSSMISLHGKYICVGCYDGYVYILERFTGEIYWKYATGDAVKSSPCIDQNHGILVIGSHDKHVHALLISKKKCLWKVFLNSSCFSSPLINGSHVYVCLLSGDMHALDLTTGASIWKVNLGKPIFSSPCWCENYIVTGCVDGVLYAVDYEGNVKWRFPTNAPIFSSPVAVNSNNEAKIIFGSNDKYLYCLDTYGKVEWKFETNATIYASIGVIEFFHAEDTTGNKRKRQTTTNGKHIVTVATNGEIFLIDNQGNCLATYILPGKVYSSLVLVNDMIIVGCRDNNMYCLQIEST